MCSFLPKKNENSFLFHSKMILNRHQIHTVRIHVVLLSKAKSIEKFVGDVGYTQLDTEKLVVFATRHMDLLKRVMSHISISRNTIDRAIELALLI